MEGGDPTPAFRAFPVGSGGAWESGRAGGSRRNLPGRAE